MLSGSPKALSETRTRLQHKILRSFLRYLKSLWFNELLLLCVFFLTVLRRNLNKCERYDGIFMVQDASQMFKKKEKKEQTCWLLGSMYL